MFFFPIFASQPTAIDGSHGGWFLIGSVSYDAAISDRGYPSSCKTPSAQLKNIPAMMITLYCNINLEKGVIDGSKQSLRKVYRRN
jgi:hypothetical protein